MSTPYQRMTKDELIAALERLEPSSAAKSERTNRKGAPVTTAESSGRAYPSIAAGPSAESCGDLYDFASVAYLVLNEDGTIAEANRCAIDLMAATVDEVAGEPLNRWIIDEDHSQFEEHLRKCCSGGSSVTNQLRMRSDANRIIQVRVTSRCEECLPQAPSRVVHTVIVDRTDRKLAEASLRASREWLDLAQRAAGAGAWEWDILAERLNWSAAQYDIFGLEPGSIEPTFENWMTLIHPDDRQRVREAGLRTDIGANLSLEFRIMHPKDGIRWVSSKGRMLVDSESPRIIGVTIDITHLKKAEDKLREANMALEQRTIEAESRATELRLLAAELTHVEQRERRRLAGVLHDHLQQLLVAAKMNVDVLCRRSEDDSLKESLDQTHRLLNDCIEASRSLTVQLSPPILHDRGLTAALHWLARWMREKHGLAVEVQADETAEPSGKTLRILLFEIVRELLFNVVKHAKAKAAELHLRRADDDHLEMVVADNGIGFHVGKMQSSEDSSIGFGLSSVHHRLELLGGHVSVESQPGKGTRVLLRAPLEQLDRDEPSEPIEIATEPETSQTPAEVSAASARFATDRIRVLLVDDHRIVREGLAGLLKQHSEIDLVGEADDGSTAVEMVRHIAPDVVIMDVNMPRMNGIEATAAITSEHPGIRVIGLSLHEQEDMAHAMFDAGAVGYVTKGGPAEDLLAAIRATAPQDQSPVRPDVMRNS